MAKEKADVGAAASEEVIAAAQIDVSSVGENTAEEEEGHGLEPNAVEATNNTSAVKKNKEKDDAVHRNVDHVFKRDGNGAGEEKLMMPPPEDISDIVGPIPLPQNSTETKHAAAVRRSVEWLGHRIKDLQFPSSCKAPRRFIKCGLGAVCGVCKGGSEGIKFKNLLPGADDNEYD